MRRVLLIALVLTSTLARAQDLGGAEGATTASADPQAQPVPPDPDAPTVGASLDRSEAYVGDRLALTVTAIARVGQAVNLAQKLELGPVELLERDDSEAAGRDLGDGRRSFRYILYVAAYEVGPAEVPSLPLTYLDGRGDLRTVSTAPLQLNIKALVDESATTPDPQPARGPRTSMVEDRRVLRVAYALGGLVGFVILALVARRIARRMRRRTRAVAGPVVPVRPPGEVAIERLEAIRARGNFAVDGYRPFAFETAEVVRAYLGARYGFDSLELTTTELMSELQRFAPHLAQPGSEVVRFVEETDLIKFANTGSNEGDALALLDAARAIVLATAPRLEIAAEMLSGAVRPPMPLDSVRDDGGHDGESH